MSDAEKMRQYRADNPHVIQRQVALAKARQRALSQLADLHPGQFAILLGAVCDVMGIDAPGTRPTGRPPRGAR